MKPIYKRSDKESYRATTLFNITQKILEEADRGRNGETKWIKIAEVRGRKAECRYRKELGEIARARVSFYYYDKENKE